MPSNYAHTPKPQSKPSIPYFPPTSHGLPGDEYQTLQRRHARQRLESHFSHRGSSNSFPSLRTAYQSADFSLPKRSHISAVQNATRQALGPSFNFTDQSFTFLTQRSQPVSCPPTTDEQASRYDEPIPQRYLDAFNQKWAEDDDIYDCVQARGDRTNGALWRRHADLPAGITPLYPVSQADSAVSLVGESRLTVQGHGCGRPDAVSRFSSDSEASLAMPRRSIFRQRR